MYRCSHLGGAASFASDAALLDSVGRFRRISLPCSVMKQLIIGPIEWIELDEWYRGRVVLIGDAAHAGPPHNRGWEASSNDFAEERLVLDGTTSGGVTINDCISHYSVDGLPR